MIRVFVLDDMQERFIYFQKWYQDRFDYTEAKKAHQAIRILRDEPRFDVYFLDHDLEEEHYGGYCAATWVGTGKDVCHFIVSELPVEKRPAFVVVHSWNPSGAMEMAHLLSDAGIKVILYKFKPGAEFLDIETALKSGISS